MSQDDGGRKSDDRKVTKSEFVLGQSKPKHAPPRIEVKKKAKADKDESERSSVRKTGSGFA